jgi:hypothetical protein
MHEFVMARNDDELTWAWEVARQCVEVYAKNLVYGTTLEDARANAWEKFSGVFVGLDGYAGMHGLADEMYWRLPEGTGPQDLDAVVAEARTQAGRPTDRPAPLAVTPPPEAVKTTPPTQATNNVRPFLRLVHNDTGE